MGKYIYIFIRKQSTYSWEYIYKYVHLVQNVCRHTHREIYIFIYTDMCINSIYTLTYSIVFNMNNIYSLPRSFKSFLNVLYTV